MSVQKTSAIVDSAADAVVFPVWFPFVPPSLELRDVDIAIAKLLLRSFRVTFLTGGWFDSEVLIKHSVRSRQCTFATLKKESYSICTSIFVRSKFNCWRNNTIPGLRSDRIYSHNTWTVNWTHIGRLQLPPPTMGPRALGLYEKKN